jgi:hypothetical protein
MATKKELKVILKRVKKDAQDALEQVENGRYDDLEYGYAQGIETQASVTLSLTKGEF